MTAAAADDSTTQAAAEPSADSGNPPAKRDGRRVKRILTIAAVVAAIAVIGFLVYHELVGKYLESTDDAYVQVDAVTVAPKVDGYVDAVLVGANQDVRAGQPLVHIDPSYYKAQAAQSQAQIKVANATGDTTRAQIAEQQAAIAEAQAQVTAARAQVDFANTELRRYEPLVRIGAEPAEQLSAKRNDAKQAAEQLARAQASLASAQRRVASLQAQVRQAEAQAGTAAAQLAAANVNLAATTVTASVNGRIGDQTVRVGQFVQPGMRLMTVVPEKGFYIEANFKETQIEGIRVGQPATVKVDAFGGTEIKGKVESFAPGTGAQFSLLPPQNATGNFIKIVQRVPVRIALDLSPDLRARMIPGLSTQVEVDTRGRR